MPIIYRIAAEQAENRSDIVQAIGGVVSRLRRAGSSVQIADEIEVLDALKRAVERMDSDDFVAADEDSY